MEAKIISEKNSVTRERFTGPSLNRIRTILFSSYISFYSRLLPRKRVLYADNGDKVEQRLSASARAGPLNTCGQAGLIRQEWTLAARTYSE